MKSSFEKNVSAKLPQPRPGRGGTWRVSILALLALFCLGGALWWLLSAPEKKEELREQAADAINDIAGGTPLAGIGDILRESPPPLPPQITHPATERGTLSGRQVTGTISSPIEGTGESSQYTTTTTEAGENGISHTSQLDPANLLASERRDDSQPLNRLGSRSQESDQPVFSSVPLPPAKEDSRVKPSYLADLARWLAARYRPGARGGTLELSPQSLNNLWGVNLAGQMQGGRSGLLRYAFHSSMLEALYKLYINQFMTDLDQAALKRGFSPEQNKDFHQAVAAKAATYASALNGILQVPDLGEKLAAIEALGQKSVEENAQLANALFELDELREKKAARTQLDTVQMRISGLTARYKRAVDNQEAAQRALAAEIRKGAGLGLDQESLLFMAAWVQRRLSEDASARNSLQTSAGIMRDLARRCQTGPVELEGEASPIPQQE